LILYIKMFPVVIIYRIRNDVIVIFAYKFTYKMFHLTTVEKVFNI